MKGSVNKTGSLFVIGKLDVNQTSGCSRIPVGASAFLEEQLNRAIDT